MKKGTEVTFNKTEIGTFPIDWKVVRLSEITSLMTNGFVGTATAHYASYDDGILYIQGYNVEENSFNFSGIKYVTRDFHKKNSKSCLKHGDLLTIQTGDVGLTTYVTKELEGSNCHALIITRFHNKIANSKFFSYYLNSTVGRSRLKEIETGSTMKHINVGDMIHFLVPLPSKIEQTAIATALSDADALISSLEKLIEKKKKIREGMMQELLRPKEGWIKSELIQVATIKMGQSPSSVFYNNKGQGFPLIQGNADLKNRKQIIRYWSTVSPKTCDKEDIIMTVRAPVGEIGVALTRSCLGRGVCAIRAIKVNHQFLYFALIALEEKWKSFEQGSTFSSANYNQIAVFEIGRPIDPEEEIYISYILSDIETELEKLKWKLKKLLLMKQGMMQKLLTGQIRLYYA